MNNPLYTHDCNRCVFLGTYQEADLYYHPGTAAMRTTVARWSDEPSDYQTGSMSSRIPVLIEARLRAEERELLSTQPNWPDEASSLKWIRLDILIRHRVVAMEKVVSVGDDESLSQHNQARITELEYRGNIKKGISWN